MEGKAALFKRFGGIDAWPICLDTQDVDEIVATVRHISPGFGGINLEDISAPRCFEVERRLRAELSIPVFHDDQHGTAIVVLAALTNALRCVSKPLPSARVVVAGGGAAGTAVVTLLLAAGVCNVLVWDREGILAPADPRLNEAKRCARGADEPGRRDRRPARRGARRRRLHRRERAERACLPRGSRTWRVAGGLCARQSGSGGGRQRRPARVCRAGHRAQRLPQSDQQRARLPGRLPRPARRPRERGHDDHAAARRRGLAQCVTDEQLNATYIVPSVFDPSVPKAVADAVRAAATATPAADPA